MEKFKLAIGIHNHQPVGNFDSVFEEAHQRAYEPFLALVEKFENIKLSLHQSGVLWKWQEKRFPGYFDLVQRLIYDERLELMTGGFYEPILPSIPERDQYGQIQMMSRFLEGNFGQDAAGLWITERVWEPHLPKVLKKAGVEYVPIDDTHFFYAGFEPDQLRGIYITEEEGSGVKLLPIQKNLRYMIPFGEVEKVIEDLRTQAEINPGGLAIYADDGEKFGVWPKTHEHCYKNGWLKDFFTALSENSDWLEVITLGEAARTKPVGRAYLPAASYAEMLHWALPPMAFSEYEDFDRWLEDKNMKKKYGRFVRGGFWRGFLAKYEESNLMHKKMLHVSKKFADFLEKNPRNYQVIDKARNHLYAAQCNCAYWHGIFGGLYLPHLRQAIYKNLIKAETELDSQTEGIEQDVFDYDCDGNDEIVVSTDRLSAVITPALGGMLAELDNREAAFNAVNTLKRRKEGYHWRVKKEGLSERKTEETESAREMAKAEDKNLDKVLAQDWHLKRCFIEHFIPEGTTVQNFVDGQYGDYGDFVLEPWEYDRSSAPGTIRLRRKGNLWMDEGVRPVKIEKSYYFSEGSDVLTVNYAITSERDLAGVKFAVENNFNFLAGHADDRYIMFNGVRKENSYLDAVNTEKGCTSVIIRDEWIDMSAALVSDRPAEVWQAPLFTVSLSENGFEKVYQGTSVISVFSFDLKKDKTLELSLMLFLGRPENMPPRMGRGKVEVKES